MFTFKDGLDERKEIVLVEVGFKSEGFVLG